MISGFKFAVWQLTLAILFCSCLAVTTTAQSRDAQERLRQSAAKFIPNDAKVGFVARPREMFAHGRYDQFPKGDLGRLLPVRGFNPLKVQSVVGCMQLSKGDERLGFVIRSAEALDIEDVAEGFFVTDAEVRTTKKSVFYKAAGSGLSLLQTTPQTIYLGREALLRSMYRREGSASSNVNELLLRGEPSDLQVTLGPLGMPFVKSSFEMLPQHSPRSSNCWRHPAA